jgi:hypothetical protein
MGVKGNFYGIYLHMQETIPFIRFFLYICKNNLYGKAKFTLNHST